MSSSARPANWWGPSCRATSTEMATPRAQTPIARIGAAAYRIPTDGPEADGTFAWESTTLVVVRAYAGGELGLGYTYADGCIVSLILATLAEAVTGRDALDVSGAWEAMQPSA